jgi:hypothetical protein
VARKSAYRRRRFWAAGSPVLLTGGTALMIALGTFILAEGPSSAPTPASGTTATLWVSPYVGWALLALAAIGVVLLALQWSAEYRKRTYDPTWALKFDALFNNNSMWQTRSKAARALKANQGKLRGDLELSDVDDVLDFFEDLGFYMKGDQITPEVVHHAFHYWIRGYYTAAREYVESAQEDDPTAWECVPELFKTIHEIDEEHAKGKAFKFCDEEYLHSFLHEEIALWPN